MERLDGANYVDRSVFNNTSDFKIYFDWAYYIHSSFNDQINDQIDNKIDNHEINYNDEVQLCKRTILPESRRLFKILRVR